MISKIYFVLAFLALLGCSSPSPQPIVSSLPVIDIDKARDYPVKRIEIREVADVEYILQETIDSSLLINDIRGYHVSDKYIVIPQSQRDILLFDRSGKYFGTVNRSGKGQENIAEYPVWLLTLYRKNIMCLIIKKQDKKCFATSYPFFKNFNYILFRPSILFLLFLHKYWPTSVTI